VISDMSADKWLYTFKKSGIGRHSQAPGFTLHIKAAEIINRGRPSQTRSCVYVL